MKLVRVASNQTCSVFTIYIESFPAQGGPLGSWVRRNWFSISNNAVQCQAGCLWLCNRIWAERNCNYFCIKTRGDANLQIGKYKTKVAPNLHCTLVIETNARHFFCQVIYCDLDSRQFLAKSPADQDRVETTNIYGHQGLIFPTVTIVECLASNLRVLWFLPWFFSWNFLPVLAWKNTEKNHGKFIRIP